jgi:hypothetical protein
MERLLLGRSQPETLVERALYTAGLLRSLGARRGSGHGALALSTACPTRRIAAVDQPTVVADQNLNQPFAARVLGDVLDQHLLIVGAAHGKKGATAFEGNVGYPVCKN